MIISQLRGVKLLFGQQGWNSIVSLPVFGRGTISDGGSSGQNVAVRLLSGACRSDGMVVYYWPTHTHHPLHFVKLSRLSVEEEPNARPWKPSIWFHRVMK